MKALHFDQAWPLACESDVLLSRNEGRLLYDLVRQAPENVVEIGSMHGGSAVILAAAGATKLTLIEPVPRPLLLGNLARSGLLHVVHLLGYPDKHVWPYWSSEISFMFLDHEHE